MQHNWLKQSAITQTDKHSAAVYIKEEVKERVASEEESSYNSEKNEEVNTLPNTDRDNVKV